MMRRSFSLLKWKQVTSSPRLNPFQKHNNRFLFSFGPGRNNSSGNQDSRIISFQGNAFFLSSNQQHSHFSSPVPSFSNWNEVQGTNRVDVEIISKQKIKPAFPTPLEWKTYKISILDQLNPNIYSPMIYFFPNNHQNSHLNINDLTSQKRHLLKQSLSETLTSFYPLAGKIQGNSHIECNDDGLYYVEAKVSTHLSNFLKISDNKKINNLLPFHPNSIELLFNTSVAMVQVNIFDCGGIAIGLYTSQKIIDTQSQITFLKAWAAQASRSSQVEIRPSYISPHLFLQNPALPEIASFTMRPILSELGKGRVTKRFLFNASSLILLKEKANHESCSDVMIVTGLIWKCFMDASEEKSGLKRPSILSLDVDLRARNSPPLSPYAIGNVSWGAIARCGMENNERELHSVVCKLGNAVDEINGDFVEGIKGEEGFIRLCEILNEFRELNSNKKVEYMGVTSLCNGGIYEVDFGWGKPSWACVGSANLGVHGLMNRVFLMDTRSGDGIEAWVTLSEKHMAILERAYELLRFGSLLAN
ncbi:hypothetical protein ACJIZ3_025025 [Penstemon smallii]|uniref:Uncharacterized protein n=1 Tax=Penstemon smallii TaxID=265156 RepID=A0ABD3TTG1_9LAMI